VILAALEKLLLCVALTGAVAALLGGLMWLFLLLCGLSGLLLRQEPARDLLLASWLFAVAALISLAVTWSFRRDKPSRDKPPNACRGERRRVWGMPPVPGERTERLHLFECSFVRLRFRASGYTLTKG
jgi:hypothetical protein